MQPYIFPYIGYYQLVNAVDTFVFFDDVNFINKGWINRNNILLQNEAYRFTVPLKKASQNKLINEIELNEYPKWSKDFLKLIMQNYKKAPCFPFFYNWLEKFFARDFQLVSELAAESVKGIAALLDLPTKFLLSSTLSYNTGEEMDGQNKVLSICRLLGAEMYINPKTAETLGLYDSEKFRGEGRELRFIHMHEIVYPQFQKEKFVPYLSIVDVLMFNDLARAKQLLEEYTI